MTLLFAAEYNVSVAVQRPFSPDLGQTINKYNPYSFLLHRTNTLYLNSVDWPGHCLFYRMTLDDYDERAELSYVINMCNRNLTTHLSDEICQQLAQTVKMETSYEGAYCVYRLLVFFTMHLCKVWEMLWTSAHLPLYRRWSLKLIFKRTLRNRHIIGCWKL